MRCADLPRHLFQVLTTASHRRPRRHRPTFETFEDKLLLSAFYVAPGGSNSADGSSLHPWATIQHAADAVAPGDTVHVAPGTYTGAVSNSKSGTASARITFVSDVPHGAMINTTGTGASVIFHNAGDYVTIQGFDMTSSDLACRLGIDNVGNYDRIIGNHVHDTAKSNSVPSSQGGAGIASGDYPSSGTAGITTGNQIIGNVVNNNGQPGVPSSTKGHGIYVSDIGPIVQNNIIYNNSGVGITTWHAATNCTISNNLIFGNLNNGILLGDGDNPGGITCDNSVVSNNIAINNGGYGIEEYGANGPNNVYINNCIYGNSVAPTSLQGGKVAQNTVTSNAGFVNYRADGTGDYHLAAGSPCIGVGTSQGAPATDFDGNPRPSPDGLYDIGPYEYQTGPDITPPTVTSESPASNATAVPISTTVTATFNESVQASSITSSTFVLKDSGGNPVSGTVAYNSSTNTATLTPSVPLAASTTYTATVSGAQDLSGHTMTGPFSWSFTTAAAITTKVTDIVVDDGSAQRSMVTRLTVNFSGPVTIASNAFELRRQGGALVGLNTTPAADGRSVVLTFIGSDIIGGSLADGHYTLTVHGDKIRDGLGQALDGDANGTAGGDYVDAAIFRLFGDGDGDGDVDNSDAFSFKAAYSKSSGQGGYQPFFDFNGDGTINTIDFAEMKKRYGNRI